MHSPILSYQINILSHFTHPFPSPSLSQSLNLSHPHPRVPRAACPLSNPHHFSLSPLVSYPASYPVSYPASYPPPPLCIRSTATARLQHGYSTGILLAHPSAWGPPSSSQRPSSLPSRYRVMHRPSHRMHISCFLSIPSPTSSPPSSLRISPSAPHLPNRTLPSHNNTAQPPNASPKLPALLSQPILQAPPTRATQRALPSLPRTGRRRRELGLGPAACGPDASALGRFPGGGGGFG